RPHRRPRRRQRRDVPQPALSGGPAGRSGGLPRPLVLPGAERGAVDDQGQQLRHAPADPRAVAHAHAGLIGPRPPGGSPPGAQALRIQPWTSAKVPRWMPVSVSRSAMVTSPGSPPPMVNSPSVERTQPTGVMTAAVPQAKTSLI